MVHSFPKAILFDMDDTILAYSQNSEQSWLAVSERFAERYSTHAPESVARAIKASSTEYWRDAERHRTGRLNMDMTRQQIIADTLTGLGIDDQSLALEMALAYAAHREDAITPFPGALDTLRELRKHHVRLALLTNGSAIIQRRRIEKHALASYFDYILIEGEFGIGKPDRRVYLHALEQLGVAPSEAWMVGDNLEWEVALPQQLGMFAVWLDFAGKGLSESSAVHPDRIIESLPELLDVWEEKEDATLAPSAAS